MNLIVEDHFEKALTLAYKLHRDQKRKGSEVPYISHLMAVASIVMDYGGSVDEVIAALLHDAVEDQGGKETLSLIEKEFGVTVAGIVSGCSDSDTTPKPPWRERKIAYLAHLKDAPRSVRFVSAADKLHNARCILADYRQVGEALWQRFTGGREGTLWYYQSLVGIYQDLEPNPIVEELARVVNELIRLTSSNEVRLPDK